MKLFRKLLGPKSKYDKNLPYAYEARIDVLYWKGADLMYTYELSDTICGLIEYLDTNNINPEEVEVFGIYKKKGFH